MKKQHLIKRRLHNGCHFVPNLDMLNAKKVIYNETEM